MEEYKSGAFSEVAILQNVLRDRVQLNCADCSDIAIDVLRNTEQTTTTNAVPIIAHDTSLDWKQIQYASMQQSIFRIGGR